MPAKVMDFDYKEIEENPILDLTIYHIPGVKVGCTKDFKNRSISNRVRYGQEIEIEVLCSGPMSIEAASDLEFMFADEYKYERGNRYSNAYRAQKLSHFLTENDPERKRKRSKQTTQSNYKMNSEIKDDTVRNEKRRAKKSKNMENYWIELKKDETKFHKKIENMIVAAKQRADIFKDNPDKVALKAQRLSKANSKPLFAENLYFTSQKQAFTFLNIGPDLLRKRLKSDGYPNYQKAKGL